MRQVRNALAVALMVVLAAPAAQARQHTIDRAALDRAVQDRVSRDQADREAILSLLHRAEVKDLAATAGLSIEKAESGVYLLHDDSLREAAAQARQAQQDLSGGRSTVVISTTTIIIILLLVILIVVIAD